MSWLDRIRGIRSRDHGSDVVVKSAAVERAAPGISELFAGLREDRSYAVLDLGPASESHLRLYSRFARHVRFVDLLTKPPLGPAWGEAMATLPLHPPRGYDVVLLWNLLDRLGPAERVSLIDTLVQHTASGARVYAVVDSSGRPTARPLRFTLLDLERVTQEAAGPPEAARGQLLPAQMERLLAPFEVTRAFTLRLQMREYVAVRP